MRRPGGMSLRTRLIGLLLATLTPLLGLGIFSVATEVRREQARVEQEAQETAGRVSAEAGRLVSGIQGMLAVLAQFPSVYDLNREEAAPLLRDVLESWPYLENVALVGTNGVVLVSAVPIPGKRQIRVEDQGWFRQTLRSGLPTLGGFQVDRVVEKPVAVLAYPVVDSTGRVTAVLTAALRLVVASQEVAPARISPPVLWAVVDERGAVLLHREPWSTLGKPLGPLAGMRRAEAVPPGTPWRVVVGIPEPTAAAALWRVLPGVGLPALLILLAAGGVAVWMARDIWRPLHALTAAVRRVGAGVPEVRLPVESPGEVGEVAAALHDALGTAAAREGELARRTEELGALVEAVRAAAFSLDPEQGLRAMVREASVSSGASLVRLFLLDEEAQLLRCRVGMGLPPEAAQGLVLRVGESLSGQVAASGRPLAVPDCREDPRPRSAEEVVNDGLISYLGVPVKGRDRVLGVLAFNTDAPRVYPDAEIACLSAFADQAAVVLERARLFATTERRATELAALQEIGQAITSQPELSAALEVVVTWGMRLLGSQLVQIVLWDEDSQVLRHGAALGPEAERVRTQVFELGRGIHGAVASGRQPMILDEYQKSPYALPEFPDVVATITVPVLFGDRLLGVLHAHTTRRGRRFAADDLRLFQMLAAQAAIAIEHARLYNTMRQRTAELEEALRLKGEFLGKVSNELHSPLQLIIRFSELLQQRVGGRLSPKQATYVDRITGGGKRLLGLFDDLLDITQEEAGKNRLHLEGVTVGPLVQEVLGSLQVQAGRKRLKVTAEPDPWLPLIVADRFRLAQILLHLAGNAVKFTPEGGSIRISTRLLAGTGREGSDGILQHPAPDEVVELVVEDSGIGIPPEELKPIFEAFYRVEGSGTRPPGGAGLGLALVRRLVQLHGGRVWAESAGLGRGARFVVRLPRLEIPKANKILLVEDEALFRIQMRSALEGAGFVVVQAASGAEALATLETLTPDLMIVDIPLPDLEGWEVLRRVRDGEEVRTLPVLVLSGRESVNLDQALAEGADDFLTKPVSPYVFVHTVVRLLGQSGAPSQAAGSPGGGPGGHPGNACAQ